MTFQQRRSLFQIREHPRGIDCVLLRLALEGLGFRRLKRQAPMKVDAAKGCRLIEMNQASLANVSVTSFAYCFCRGRSKPDITRVY